MKKKRLLGLTLLAPLCLLAACGGGGPTTIPIEANWNRNTTSTSIDKDTHEALEYTVTFIAPVEPSDYYVTYDEGTYTTELEAYLYKFDDGSTANVYHYHTELHISGRYVLGSVMGETFNDYVISDVYFHGITKQANNFRPIESHKEIHSTNPNSYADYMSETLIFTYDAKYSTAAAVNAPLESVAVTGSKVTTRVDRVSGEQSETKEAFDPVIEIDTDDSYFDNEQILFALRGIGMDQAVNFETNNMQTHEIATVNFVAAPKATVYTETFNIDGSPRPGDGVDAYEVQFIYDATQSGTPRTVTYAKQTAPEDNTYRNVLLRLDDPIADGYGTLRYTLKNASFIAR